MRLCGPVPVMSYSRQISMKREKKSRDVPFNGIPLEDFMILTYRILRHSNLMIGLSLCKHMDNGC